MNNIKIKWKYFLSWIPGIPIAIVNGVVRESVFSSFLSELHAHQLSVLSFSLLFGIYVRFVIGWLELSSPREAVKLGSFWLLLTIGFEFLFGRFMMGRPWSFLFRDYNLAAGRLWLLVLLWIAVSPSLFVLLRRH